MYNVLQPIYSFHLDHNRERVRDANGNGCFTVTWKKVGEAKDMAEAKKLCAVPVLESIEDDKEFWHSRKWD